MFLSLTPTTKTPQRTQKIAPKGPKKYKGGLKCSRIKNKKHKAVLPKPRLIVYIVGPKKVFELDNNLKHSPAGPKK